MAEEFGKTSNPQYSQFIALSRYARFIDKKGRRELWPETVDRLITFWKEKYPELEKELDNEVKPAILNLDVMGSMRALMTAGPALDRCNVAGYNCSYTAIESPRDFDEILYILMNGTGVGFSVERQYVNKLPEVAEKFHETDTVIHVRDSKLGWAKAFKELLSLLWNGEVPQWDLSKIRPAGARLKTFGGRASGPEPLNGLFQFTVNLFQRAAGRKLTSLECHDLVCKIADIVVVGGVRRAALISLSNLSDDRMRNAKSGQWWQTSPHRALANNSYTTDDKPDYEVFLEEWLSLYKSRSGERGIFSREASKNQAKKTDRRDTDYDFGTNPCCFTGDMKLLTIDGYKPFAELKDKSVKIVNNNGDVTEGSVWSSGNKPIVSVEFQAGLKRNPITCTHDHIFMLTDGSECRAEELAGKRIMPNISIKNEFDSEAMLVGFMIGDGSLSRLNSERHRGLEVHFSNKDGDVAEMFGRKAGEKWYSREAYELAQKYDLTGSVIGTRGFPYNHDLLSGIFSANGCVIKNTRVALKSTDRKQLETVKLLLSDLGIESYITTNKEKKNVFSNGEYTCKESYDLNIGCYDSILKFAEYVSFAQQYKRDRLHELLINKAPKVRTVKEAGIAEVFDFTEPETHWGIVENCVVHNSEIILRNKQFCNLSEVVVRPNDDINELKRKVRLATILGTLQASLTDFSYLRKKWKDNSEEERLLGVSLTGIMDNPLMYKTNNKLSNLLDELREVAIETNKEYAEKIGIKPSASISCVKPSGTVSQLVDSASGIHPRFSEYYIRTVRADKKDPLATFMLDKGFYAEEDQMNPSNWVFYFPMKAPDNAVTVKDMGAMDQLNLWKVYQDHWCEHKPSMTCYYTDDEFLEVGNWVWNNFDEISGISFLPYDDHVYPQAPYQPVTKERYEEWMEVMPKDVDWTELVNYENDDQTSGSQELACSSGSCEI